MNPVSSETGSRRPPLAVVLHQRRDALLANWSRRILEDPTVPEATRLSQPALRDHIPTLLDDVIDALLKTEPQHPDHAAAELAALASTVRQPAQAHARDRLKNGYSLAQALRELTHFRGAVVDVCILEGEAPPDERIRLLHGAIDVAMNTVAVEMERAAREHLEAEQQRLREEAAFRERFLAILGHDLRNPLSAIVSGAGLLLRRDETPGANAEILHRMVASAERMGRMINDLLDLTRVRGGGPIPIGRQPTDLDAVCLQAIDELRLAHPARTIMLSVRGSGRGDWDPDRMAQVVQNLVGNALDYSPPDTNVEVVLDGEGADVVLKVHNHGEPIPPEELDRIFEPFARGAHSARAPAKGLGLGLFIANEIVKAHGGSVDVTSSPGEGTAFTVSLPRAATPRPSR